MPTNTRNKTITGVDGAVVLLKPRATGQPPGEVFLRRGEDVPDNLLDGEFDRLTSLGVFAEPPGPPVPVAVVSAQLVALEAELSAATSRAEAAERTAEQVKAELDAARKAAPASSRKVEPPNPANPVTTPPPVVR